MYKYTFTHVAKKLQDKRVTTPDFLILNGQIKPWNQGLVHVWTETAQRGLNVFDAVRGFFDPTTHTLRLVGLDDHLARLIRSARLLGFPCDVNETKLRDSIGALINKIKPRCHIYIRPTIFIEKGGYEIVPGLMKECFYVVIFPISTSGGYPHSITTAISSFRKIPPEVFPSIVKAGATYGLSRLARLDAFKKGAREAFLVNMADNLCETPGANIFLLRGDMATTPPLSDGALDGITRKHLTILLEKHFGVKVEEASTHRKCLSEKHEVFVCGTLAEVEAVVSCDNKLIGNGDIGTLTKELAALYHEMCTGKLSTPWVSIFDLKSGCFKS